MAYAFSTAPPDGEGPLRGWLVDQLRQIAATLLEPAPRTVTFTKLNAAPAKLFDGLTAFADGTNWNPGAGQGVYTYYAGAWNKLG
jgi:hypothetical protein